MACSVVRQTQPGNLRRLFLLCTVALLQALPAVQAKELRIVTIESAPFGFVGPDRQPTGMMYEIGNLIATEAGFTYSNQLTPYARSAHAVVHGDADFVLRYSSAELAAAAIPVTGVLRLPTIVVGKPASRFESLADLHGKTVGTPRGGRFDASFEADTAILKYQVADYSQML
ncbi:transporter substrate-binding domain-containing protein [Rhodoferax sp. AJA081-3]|uniref:substrate-binding periplasmic protein n=1 Tax=Rhodoferax sp. AJA081-3 TaxID=2752316 RepID=UPI001ADFD0DD|nr:transporter substrate-binding domain-containing protein [Rhodoferax sp. AJA081-3]QTN29769.1 transporter substrate-binding domain-containing protein [Rhodoferax sp. AJA081-3]